MITIENVSKRFSSKTVLSGVSLQASSGNITCLLGRSGSGKTTLLRMINKLTQPDSGRILVNGRPVTQTPDRELRFNMGYVIQSGGLFPHMTVRKNIILPLELQKIRGAEAEKRVLALMEQASLDLSLLNKYPAKLSGGQQQRVGIVRAIATNPSIILLDEPFSALDPVLRNQMQDDFLNMTVLRDKTRVLVTHDVAEALKLADQINLLAEGNLVFTGSPREFLESSHPEVRNYLGTDKNLFRIRGIKLSDVLSRLKPSGHTPADAKTVRPGTPLYQVVAVSAEHLTVAETNQTYPMYAVKNAFHTAIHEIYE